MALINFVFIISRLEFCPFIVTWLAARDTNMCPGVYSFSAFSSACKRSRFSEWLLLKRAPLNVVQDARKKSSSVALIDIWSLGNVFASSLERVNAQQF